MIETPKEAAGRLARAAIRGDFKPEALHTYTDENGEPIYWRIRARLADGSKWIRPMRKNGSGCELGEPEFPNGKPLYRLHELAAKPGAPVWYVEGENCADKLARLGVLATTAGSASSDEAADFVPLKGRTVTLWPDNDAPGIAHGERVAEKLRSLGCHVTAIDVAALALPEGGDVVNWIKAHPNATAADLAKLPRVRAATEAPTGDSVLVRLIRGSELEPKPIAWLWRDFLARGKLHIIAGAPGAGKTTITLALAATVTCGGRFPDGTQAEPGNVLIWSGEDDPKDTLLPRLIAMGADLSRIYFVGDIQAEGKARPFDPARDMAALEVEAARVGDVRLLIVDPIVNAVAGDSHKNTETRRALQPVVDLAARLGAAALGVSHFSKNTAGRDPVERVTGSVAFGALPRIIFGAAKSTEENGQTRRLFVRAKSNIGPDGGGFNYALEQVDVPGFPGLLASRVAWGHSLDGTALELLAVAEAVGDSEERGALTEVTDWLRDLLTEESGPMDKREIIRLARDNGFSERTIYRARDKLGVHIRTTGFGKAKRSVWSILPMLPTNNDGKNGNIGSVQAGEPEAF